MAQPQKRGNNNKKIGVREKLIIIWVLGIGTFIGVLSQITYPTPYEYKMIKELALGNRVPYVSPDFYTTPLHKACVKGDLGEVKDYIQQYDINVRDEYLNTPLISACHLGGNPEVVSFLLNHGSNPNLWNVAEKTALHYAIQFHRADIVGALLECNQTDVSQMSFDHSPVYMAACISDNQILSMLIHKGSNIYYHDEIFDTPLHKSANTGYLPNVKLLVESGAKIDAQNLYHETPLFFAVEQGFVAVVDYLIEKGAYKSYENHLGETVLHIATHKNLEKIVDLLIKDKTMINVLDNNKHTPLYYAVVQRNNEIVNKLCKAGADYRIGVNPFTDEKLIPQECKQNVN